MRKSRGGVELASWTVTVLNTGSSCKYELSWRKARSGPAEEDEEEQGSARQVPFNASDGSSLGNQEPLETKASKVSSPRKTQPDPASCAKSSLVSRERGEASCAPHQRRSAPACSCCRETRVRTSPSLSTLLEAVVEASHCRAIPAKEGTWRFREQAGPRLVAVELVSSAAWLFKRLQSQLDVLQREERGAESSDRTSSDLADYRPRSRKTATVRSSAGSYSRDRPRDPVRHEGEREGVEPASFQRLRARG